MLDLELFTRLGSEMGRASALTTLAEVEMRRSAAGDAAAGERALDLLDEALTAAEAVSALEQQANILRLIGIVYRRTAHPAEALQSLRRCLSIQEKLGDFRGRGATLVSYGVALADAGRMEDAERALREGEMIFAGLTDLFWRAASLYRLGKVLKDRDRRSVEGRSHLEQAARIADQIGAGELASDARTALDA